ncbi:MAG TPA: hypothetical protein PKL57_19820, partial [Candidatus Wallbacteria bacterium]|nr:hypothetical protein [Candidatus Wallbacteria bacterium]
MDKNHKIILFGLIAFSVILLFPPEALAQVDVTNYYWSGGKRYITPGVVTFAGYYPDPLTGVTVTFSGPSGSYSVGANCAQGPAGAYSGSLGPVAQGENYYISASWGSGNGPFTVGYPDSVPPYNASLSCTGTASSLNVTLTGTAMDNVGVTLCCMFEDTSSGPSYPPPSATWYTPVNIGGNTWQRAITLNTSKNIGTKYFYAWFKDAIGNMSTRAGTTFNVTDSVSPTGSFTISQPAG